MQRVLNVTSADEIAGTPVRWLVDGLVPLGKITVLAGPPGLGKSLSTVKLAADVTRGDAQGDLRHVRGDVLMASAEDDASDTIVPRRARSVRASTSWTCA